MDSGLTIGSIAGLFGTMFVLSAVPGPSIVAVAGRSLASGLSHGLVTILGIVFGNVVFILLAVLGMSSLAHSMGHWFVVINYLGAAYLLWMGIRMLRARVKSIEIEGIDEPSWLSNFLCGLFITLGAPRAILFYVSFLPAYSDLTRAGLMEILWIMVIATLAVGGAKLVYALLAHKSRELMQSENARRTMDLTAASVMILTAIWLILKAALVLVSPTGPPSQPL
jgi:threonine/homoserine/homoserine lactone efflux protein